MKKVLAIPDLHSPATDIEALCYLYSYVQAYKPDVVITLGDDFDLFSFSRWPHTRNWMTPKQELEEGRKLLEAMWANIKKCAPKARCIALSGNHNVRIAKKMTEAIPELMGVNFNGLKEYFEFKGVERIHDEREEFEIDNILYIHGFLSRQGTHLRHFEQSVVFGHIHKAWIEYHTRRGKTLFEMCTGHLSDQSHIPMQYTRTKTTGWTRGFGIVDEYGPRFIAV